LEHPAIGGVDGVLQSLDYLALDRFGFDRTKPAHGWKMSRNYADELAGTAQSLCGEAVVVTPLEFKQSQT
jgi:hypothetical protein